MCDLDWSRRMFSYDRFLPFAKFADIRQDISKQTKDENGYSRYWNRVFRFGDTPLLIMSQWYAKDKESFEKWYESLFQPQTKTDSAHQIEKQELSPPDTRRRDVKIKPVKMILLGTEYPVRAWNEMYIKICEVMLLHRPYCMAAMARDADFNKEHRKTPFVKVVMT
jgi:hypothetical protein